MEARLLSPLFNAKVVNGSDGVPVFEPLGSSSPSLNQGAGGGSNGPSGPSTGGTGEPSKRKRGRPRKYGPDGKVILAVKPVSTSPAAPRSTGLFSPAANMAATTTAAAEGMKKARGRPPGSSKKKQLEALGSAGAGFIPHVITIKTGEDVSAKILAFSQQTTRAICVLSANGAISDVTLRQADISGGAVTYEGRFEILSLSGSFMLHEIGGQRSRTGGLSVSLAGPDGHVVGGGVAGLLTAASPVQVILGSFIAEGKKEFEQINASELASDSGKLALLGEIMEAINATPGAL